MSQQIQASIPSPVSPVAPSPVAAPSPEAQGSTVYPQLVAQAATLAVASATTQQAPSQATPPTVPTTSDPSSLYPSSPSPSNPWEQAMGSLERMVSRMAPPSQAQPSAYSQAPQTDTAPSSQPSQAQPWEFQASTAAPTSPNSVSTTPNSFPASTASSEQLGLSDVTRQVVEHFGAEAPGILNQYSITLEDALIAQNERMEALTQEGQAMQHILTDPDQLADYTNRFFTEVYPVDAEQPAAEAPAPQQQYRQDYNMPAPPAANAGGGVNVDPRAQWEGFASQMDQNPENAWRYLSQMGPEAIRSKLLFMDNR